MTLLSILLIGFFLGVKHALESDHLAAVATLATGEQSLLATMRQGVAWGVGHTVTLIIVGGGILILGTAIPTNLERALELAVGIMLAALGGDVIRRVLRQRIHFHVHRHDDGAVHIHAHRHAEAGRSIDGRGAPAAYRLPAIRRRAIAQLPVLVLDHASAPHAHDHARALPLRALAVGMMHGLAGSAALVVLSLHTVRSVPIGLGYIALFGVGSILGMALLSVTIAIPLRLSGRHLTRLYRAMASSIGALTLGLGVWIVYRIGFAEGLLLG
jgi:ABC-type nickel/cobalt efflux system permease component RcnA